MRILQVVHGFPPAASGGTEIYVHDLTRALASSGTDRVVVLTRDADPLRPEYGIRESAHGAVTVFAINNTFQGCCSFEESYSNPALLRAATDLLDDIEPDIAHVQHLTCLSTGLLQELARRSIPVVMTLNDYWLICHRGQLLDADDRPCAGPFDAGCGRCIPGGMLVAAAAYRAGRIARALPLPGVAAAVRGIVKVVETATPLERTRQASVERLAHMRAATRHVDLWLAPSQTIADRFLRFGVPPNRLVRCEQGIDAAPFGSIRRRPADRLRIAFAGALIPSKAPHVLLEAAARLPPGSVTLDLLGGESSYHGEGGYADRLRPLLQQTFVRRVGPVPHDRVAALFADVDVLAVPSVWIENAPFVIREAFAARLPVVASRLGGMAELVTHDVNGLLFEAGNPSDLAVQLRRLQSEPDLLERLRRGIIPPMTIEEDARQVRRIYENLLRNRRSDGDRVLPRETRRRSSRIADLSAIVLNYCTPDQTHLTVRSLQTSFARPGRITVVDNGSPDGSAEQLRCSLDDVEILTTGTNLGFSGGCNVAISAALAADARYVLLINSDAVLAPDALERLVRAADRDDRRGIVAPVILSREEPDRIASAGIVYGTRSGRMRHLSAGQPLARSGPAGIREVTAVSGCAMLVRREVFDRVGLLDEEYFFSFEDIDFCLKARDAGFRTVCVSEALAYHEGGRSIGRRSARRVYFATRNHLRLASRTADGTPLMRTLRGGFIVGLNAAYVLRAADAPLLQGLAAVAHGTWHHLIGRYGRR